MILVTGCLGTLGLPLYKKLKNSVGCDLVHTGFEASTSISAPNVAHYMRCDVSSYRQLQRVLDWCKPDLIYHTAAEFGRWNGEDFYEQVWKTNVIGFKHLLTLAKCPIIHFSSSEVYGDYPGLMDVGVEVSHRLNDYALSKHVNEEQIRNSGRSDVTIVRPFNSYGPGEYYTPYRSVVCRLMYCAINNLPMVVYEGHLRPHSYIDDVVNQLILVKDRGSGIYNIGTTGVYSNVELANMICDIVGVSRDLIVVKPTEHQTTIMKHFATSFPNYEPTVTLMEGLRLTYDWMSRNI